MFEADRDELLAIAIFRANENTANLQAVEVWKYAGDENCNETNFRHISIQDDQVEAWLGQEEQFAPPKPDRQDAVLEGAIRLLFCERVDYRPPGFGMSRDSFLAVSKQFNLPISTLSSIFNYQGTFSRQFVYSSASPDKLQRITFVVKAPEKNPIGNYCLSLSQNSSTKVTTAFIHGTSLHMAVPVMCPTILSHPLSSPRVRHHGDYTFFDSDDGPAENTQSSHLLSRLRSSIAFWGHPLLLPILILHNYMSRSNLFAWDLHDQVVSLERQTGVVFAGRPDIRHEWEIEPEKIPRDTIKSLTKEMHTLQTQIIFFERVVTWMVDCARFLNRSVREMAGTEVHGQRENALLRESRGILEMLELIEADAMSLCGMQKSLKERVQSQITVLYSFIAQIDNSINARIAISSARDSSAMKTLALITTVFLPGTYVATLFSMSMFSWSQPSAPGASSDVSNKFWIYWAVTIPLTLLVMLIWRIWWLWQERSYEKEVNEAVGNRVEKIPSTSSSSYLSYNPPRGRNEEGDTAFA